MGLVCESLPVSTCSVSSCSQAEVVRKQEEGRSSAAVPAARKCCSAGSLSCCPLPVTQAGVEEPAISG